LIKSILIRRTADWKWN